MASDNPLSAEHLFEHVQDATYFHVPRALTPWIGTGDGHGGGDGHGAAGHAGHIEIPQPLAKPAMDEHGHAVVDPHTHATVYEAVWRPETGVPVIDDTVKPLDFVVTKFMVIETLVAIICVVIFAWLAAQIRGGRGAKGRLANMLEAFVVFIRDDVAKVAIGNHGYEKFTPYLCTVFFFVLGCNLFGMIPWMGSPTGAFAVTLALAFATFVAVCSAGIAELGFAGFVAAQAPTLDLPLALKIPLLMLIWPIEVFGLFLKHTVLAVRLLANMVAGHLILAVLIGFIGVATGVVWFAVTPVSIAGAVAISVLELFVAFLQAYVFTFLSALFIGAAVHPH